ncbi:MAG: ComEC/Rec2 family competence protein [Alphaproteobacteria bacterium]|nr:ComEC/Rec2 family competence protein [Alphaproteobacteria bacterium]
MSVSAVLIASGAGIHRATARIRDGLRSEVSAQGPRWRLWTPVAFGAGCAAYFVLGREPPLWPLVALAIVTGALWSAARRAGRSRRWTLPLLLLACLALGLATAKVRSARIAAPIAPALSEPTVIEAWVIDVDSPGERGARVVIAPVRVRGLEPAATPHRLRATLRGEPPPPGASVRLFAILNPPPAPASPGAYDFGRNAWFQGMGGVAFALGETRPAILADAPWRLRLAMAVNRIRYGLAQRIVARLGERNGGIAAAMTTGHETWIRRADLEVMRDSGLAHILSISGLHMAIVGGFVFFAVRFGIAAVPWLVLRMPGKKVAAWAGWIAVVAYLIISGAPPPAERAAITASVAFLAIILDRPAISMNALAVAAFAVLLLQPEAIVTPGFQMSFAATAALVALAESWPRRPREIKVPLPILIVQRAGTWVGLAILASFVAGMATGPFAMQHFNRTAVYGLLANMISSPIADFIMMPMLALGVVLQPLGLGGPFLTVAGWGIEAIMAVGAWISTLPGAVIHTASAPVIALPVAFIGILVLCLWRGRLRWLGLPLACAVLVWPRHPTPDLWIADAGTNAAIVTGDEALVVRTVGAFSRDVWSGRRGLTLVERPAEGWTCGRVHCAPEVPGPLALWWGRSTPDVDQLAALYQAAEVVSVRVELTRLPEACADRLVLDGRDYAAGGSVELWRTEGSWRALWSTTARGARPWNRLGDPDYQE